MLLRIVQETLNDDLVYMVEPLNLLVYCNGRPKLSSHNATGFAFDTYRLKILLRVIFCLNQRVVIIVVYYEVVLPWIFILV